MKCVVRGCGAHTNPDVAPLNVQFGGWAFLLPICDQHAWMMRADLHLPGWDDPTTEIAP